MKNRTNGDGGDSVDFPFLRVMHENRNTFDAAASGGARRWTTLYATHVTTMLYSARDDNSILLLLKPARRECKRETMHTRARGTPRFRPRPFARPPRPSIHPSLAPPQHANAAERARENRPSSTWRPCAYAEQRRRSSYCQTPAAHLAWYSRAFSRRRRPLLLLLL